MLDERALRNPFSRRFIALMGALVLAATGGFVAAAPAHADDDGPIYWEWTDAPYWEASFQAGLPTQQYWLAGAAGGGDGAASFSAEP